MKAEIKIEGIIYSVPPLDSISQAEEQQGALSADTECGSQAEHRDPDSSCRSHHSRRSAIICFICLGHNEPVQAAGQAGVTAAVPAPA